MALKQSEILGLFTSPRDIQALQRDRVAQEAQMYDDPIARQMYMSSAGLAGGLGQAFGANIQGQAEASQIEKIRKEVPFDVDNQSAYYTQLAQRLINQGLTQAGAQALELAKKARLDEATVRKQEATQKGDLSVTAEKEINKANEAYSDAIGNASKAAELAATFRQKSGGLSGGISAVIGETWKDLVGGQDEISLLRKQYVGVRNSQGLSSLPPGAASDTDVKLALSAFPDETANADYIASFLDGMAKSSMIDAEFNKFRANYLSQNRGDAGGLIPAWQEYYRGLDLAQLFAQQGLPFNPSTVGQGVPTTPIGAAAGTTDWSSL